MYLLGIINRLCFIVYSKLHENPCINEEVLGKNEPIVSPIFQYIGIGTLKFSPIFADTDIYFLFFTLLYFRIVLACVSLARYLF